MHLRKHPLQTMNSQKPNRLHMKLNIAPVSTQCSEYPNFLTPFRCEIRPSSVELSYCTYSEFQHINSTSYLTATHRDDKVQKIRWIQSVETQSVSAPPKWPWHYQKPRDVHVKFNGNPKRVSTTGVTQTLSETNEILCLTLQQYMHIAFGNTRR